MRTLESLKTERAEMLDPLDIPGSWTLRQREAYEDRRKALGHRITGVQVAEMQAARYRTALKNDEAWRAELLGFREVLAAELVATPPARSDRERGRQQNLKLSLRVIDVGLGHASDSGYGLNTLRLGQLMQAAGYQPALPREGQCWGDMPWFGSLAEVEWRLQDARSRVKEAERMLAGYLVDDAPASTPEPISR